MKSKNITKRNIPNQTMLGIIIIPRLAQSQKQHIHGKIKMNEIVQAINKYGFPIVAAGGMGYLIYYVWQWATTEIKPVLSAASTDLIALIDRVRMLDNDLIRLNQKVNVTLHLRGASIERERMAQDAVINKDHSVKTDDKG